jgi:hypothetical protein
MAMPFRFSMKWILAAMAYTAITAAAFHRDSHGLSSVLVAISIAAGCHAVLLCCYARGEFRAKAFGFLLMFSANVLCLYFVPQIAPSTIVLLASGYFVQPDGTVQQWIGPTNHIAATGGAVGTLIAGLIGSLLGRIAYRRAHHGHPRTAEAIDPNPAKSPAPL